MSERIKNLSLYITAISVVIGGSMQVYFLTMLSGSYLRFFSITQLIADTLSIVIPVLYFSFLAISFILIGALFNPPSQKDKKEQDSNQKIFNQSFLMLFFIIVCFSIVIFSIYKGGDSYIEIIKRSIFPFIYGLIALLTFKERFINFYNSHKPKCILVSIFVITSFILYGLDPLFNFLYKTIIIPQNFINQTYICPSQSTNCTIRYFNDKYIFIERSEGQIEILPFESFFNQE